jgi:hypothetical protein
MKHTAWLALALAASLHAQSPHQPIVDPTHSPNPDAYKPPPGMVEKQTNDRNAERQHRLESDTDRLLILATQLKKEVDDTNKNILSIEVVRKAEEIEKLARSVKERMKG